MLLLCVCADDVGLFLCHSCNVFLCLTVLEKDRKWSMIKLWVTQTVLQGFWHHSWLDRVSIVVIVGVHCRHTNCPMFMENREQ